VAMTAGLRAARPLPARGLYGSITTHRPAGPALFSISGRSAVGVSHRDARHAEPWCSLAAESALPQTARPVGVSTPPQETRGFLDPRRPIPRFNQPNRSGCLPGGYRLGRGPANEPSSSRRAEDFPALTNEPLLTRRRCCVHPARGACNRRPDCRPGRSKFIRRSTSIDRRHPAHSIL
jgi:hypothetical protein